jgi:hypothetical protein
MEVNKQVQAGEGLCITQNLVLISELLLCHVNVVDISFDG